jgi:polyisoprenoid-binding protein YceI
MSITEAQVIPAGTWTLDKVHSTVGFAIDYMAGTFQGSFSDFDAELRDGTLSGQAKVASIEVKDPNLAAHLQAPDFFDAERHPELSFQASDIRQNGGTLELAGEITIKGHTEPVQISGSITGPLSDPYGGERVGIKLTATIDRTAFGINWNNPLPSGEPALSNTVTLTADLQLSHQA